MIKIQEEDPHSKGFDVTPVRKSDL